MSAGKNSDHSSRVQTSAQRFVASKGNVGIEFVSKEPKVAEPGYFLLEALADENDCPASVNKIPVIAWLFETETYAPYPVTLEGLQIENYFILRPDGFVEQPCSCLFDSLDDWLDWMKSEHAEKSKGRAYG